MPHRILEGARAKPSALLPRQDDAADTTRPSSTDTSPPPQYPPRIPSVLDQPEPPQPAPAPLAPERRSAGPRPSRSQAGTSPVGYRCGSGLAVTLTKDGTQIAGFEGHFIAGHCTAVDTAQQEPGHRLRGGGLVEHVPTLGAQIVLQPRAHFGKPLPEERIRSRIPTGQLCRMHVPALVEAPAEGTHHEPAVQRPGGVDLLRAAHWQDVGGPVREPYAGARGGDLHHGLGMVGGRMLHG